MDAAVFPRHPYGRPIIGFADSLGRLTVGDMRDYYSRFYHPGNATLVYVLKLYREAFEYHKMGYASAMAWVLFLVLLVLTGVVVKTSKSWVHYEGLK